MGFTPHRGVRRVGTGVAFLAAIIVATAISPAAAQLRDHLYSVSAANAREAWAAGAFGTIVHTDDGGVHWRRQVSNTEEHLFGIGFADANNGWAVGRTGVIVRTRDGGEIWEIQDSPLDDRHLFDVAAIDTNTAAAIGDWGSVLYTSDGGQTWVDRSFSRDVILNDQYWLDAERAWIVGEGGVVLTTRDAGRTWVEQPSGVFKTLFGVHFVDAERGWAAGIDGLILRTSDGGTTWESVRGRDEVAAFDDVGVADAFGNPTLFDIAISGDHGIAVGDLGGVFLSADGGTTWKRHELSGEAALQWVRGVTLVDGGHGFFVGGKGMTARVAAGQVAGP